MWTRFETPKTLVVTLALSLSLSACAEGEWNKETGGTLLGAALGGWVGSQIDSKGSGGAIAIATGVVVGGLVGSSIGRSLDKADQLYLERTRYEALEKAPSGTTSEWYNPDSGNSGAVTPKPAYQTAQGDYCREFTQEIIVGGKKEVGYGTACRQPDGAWKIVQ